MSDSKVTVGVVAALDEAIGTGDATLRLADGSALKVPRTSPQFQFIVDWVKKKKTRPLYVESDAATGEVKLVLPAAMRRIERLAAEPVGDRLAVDVFMSPSRHFLSTKHPNFVELRSLLQEAIRNKEPLLVTVHPEHMEILDARRPPPGLDLPVI